MKLYKLVCGIGEYWVIATDPTTAENKLLEVLNAGEGYGFSGARQVHSIYEIAEAVDMANCTKDHPYNITGRKLIL